MGIFWLHSFTHLVYLVTWVSVYLEGQDVCDLIILCRAVWCGDVRVTAAADSGLEEHVANCGCCCSTHRAVTAFCWGYNTSWAWNGRQTMKYHVILKICAPKKIQEFTTVRIKWINRMTVNHVSTCVLCFLRGVRKAKHPVKVWCQEAIPPLLVPVQLLTVVKTVDNGNHWFEGDLGQVRCGTHKHIHIISVSYNLMTVRWINA